MQAIDGSEGGRVDKILRIERGNRIARIFVGIVIITMGALMFTWPSIERAAGSWEQHALATETDMTMPRYAGAVRLAYASVFSEMEALVSFEIGALPTTVGGSVIGVDGDLPSRQPVDEAGEKQDGNAGEQRATDQQVARVFEGGTIRIPSIGVDQAIVRGVGRADLRQGPGHYPGTALPGTRGNTVISGHRTTYTKPFHDLDRLDIGDAIWVDTAEGSFKYIVQESFVVDPTNVEPLRGSDRAILTLTTCNPKGSAAQRLVVVAALGRGQATGDLG